MLKAGIIGGMGPESTVEYYRGINQQFQVIAGNQNEFPNFVLESINIFEMLGYCKAQEYDRLVDFLLGAINNVKGAGADFGVLAANTPHIVFDDLIRLSPIPLLSIVDATYEMTKQKGIKKVALLGTKFTMQQEFFKRPFVAGGIQVIVPDNQTVDRLHEFIENELEHGIIKEQTRDTFVNVIEAMIENESIDGVILGCTELPLLLSSKDISIPILDTMKIHIQTIVKYMLG